MWPGKANCGNEVLAFLVSATKEGRRSRRRQLQMQLALDNRRRVLNLVSFYFCLFPKEHHSSSSSSFLSPVSLGFISFLFFIFSQKTNLAVRHRTACYSTQYTIIVFEKLKQAVFAGQN